MKNNKERINIYGVASKARVSLATVSRVINSPELVKEETRERVLKIIREYDYKPNAIAKSLASKKPTFIGIVVPDFSRNSVAESVNGICNIARIKDDEHDFGYQVMVFLAENENRETVDVWREISASQIDGLLYLNDLDNEYDREKLNGLPIPVVVCNAVVNGFESGATVNIDNEKAAYEATKRLIDKGRKNIVFLNTNRLYPINEIKEKGYTRAMEEAGLGPITLDTSGKPEINHPHIVEFLDDYKGIDGVIGVRDSITVAFMNELLNRGYKIPDDVEIYSLQNTKYASLARPAISSINVPLRDMGVKALELLTKLMNEEEVSEEDKHVVVDYTFSERQTTK